MDSTDSALGIERFFRAGLKLQHLRILVRLSQLGQVRKVAEAFHVTQPAISKQIAEMESALQLALVQRVGRRLEFTAAGETLVSHGREVLHQLEQARVALDALACGLAGKITIGAVATVTPVLIPSAIARFRRQAPNASVTLLENTTDRLFPMLLDGEVDLVVSRTPPPAHMSVQEAVVGKDPIVVVCGAQHPLAFRRAMKWADLRGVPWILPPERSAMFQALRDVLERRRLALPAGCVESNSLQASPILLEAGTLVGLLPLSAAQKHVDNGSLCVLPLGLSNVPATIRAVWRGGSVTPIARLMHRCLEAAGQDAAGA